MSHRSSLLRIPAARGPALSRACNATFFCMGVMILPPLIAANLSVWLGCQHLSVPACVQILSLALVQF